MGFPRICKASATYVVLGGGALAAGMIGLTGTPSAAAAAGYAYLFDDNYSPSDFAGPAASTSTGSDDAAIAAFIDGERSALATDPAYTTDLPYQAAGESLIGAQQDFINNWDQLQNSMNQLLDTVSGPGANWSEAFTEFTKFGSALLESANTITELVTEGIKFDEASPEHLEVPILIIAG